MRFAIILTCCTLCACATAAKKTDAGAAPVNKHQDPNSPNPNAIPKETYEWLKYICEDLAQWPDEQARMMVVAKEQHDLTITCLKRADQEKAQAADTGDAALPPN